MQAFPTDTAVVPRVLVVADDPLVRSAFVHRLGPIVVGQSNTLAADDGSTGSPANVALWDVGPRDEAITERLTAHARLELPTVVLLPEGSRPASRWMEGGTGLLSRDASIGSIRAALDGVLHGLAVLDPEIRLDHAAAAEPLDAEPSELLTPREHEVLELLASGCSNRQIAEALHISVHTAKFHVNSILTKLGAQTRTEAVVRAVQRGWVML